MTRGRDEDHGSIPLAPGAHAALFLHPDAGDVAVDDEPALARRLSRQLPDPGTLGPGSWIALGSGPAAPRRLFGLLGARRSGISLAVRCTALLARGYTDICADESGTAFGRVPG